MLFFNKVRYGSDQVVVLWSLFACVSCVFYIVHIPCVFICFIFEKRIYQKEASRRLLVCCLLFFFLTVFIISALSIFRMSHALHYYDIQVSSIKVIRNKQTGISEGYGFVEFLSHTTAEKVLHNYSTVLMPNTELTFRLNWATSSTGDKRSEKGSDLSIFVGDLAADVTDSILQETFASKYSSVKAAKVVYDPNTGCSKGYGFVRFGDDNERSQAMTDMNGVYCSSRPMRIGAATPKKSSGYQHQYSSQGSQYLFAFISIVLSQYFINVLKRASKRRMYVEVSV